jgi:hypothetical protein
MTNPCEKHKNVKADFCPICLYEQNEKFEKILQEKENCPRCKGRGYNIHYDHQSYPVPHDIEYKFLCNCISEEIVKFLEA